MIGGAHPYRTGSFRLPFSTGEYLLTTNARSAIYILRSELKPKDVWVPSYICKSVLSAIPDAKFYSVDASLRPNIPDAKKGDMILVVDYFGFPYLDFVSEAIVVEDASQAFFSSKQADFVIYSAAKILGSPDGGILWAKNYDLSHIRLDSPPLDWVYAAREGRRRERVDWFEMTQVAKRLSPVGFYSMHFTECLAFEDNWLDICVNNYNYLYEGLAEYSVTGQVVPGCIPTGFPIRVPDRSRLLKRLYAANIYPPIHWDISFFVPKQYQDSHALSQEILTLPCDYRYDESDMERIICEMFND